MKKILLTTSALTLLAGAAAADVNVSGYGRIGISSTDGKSSQYTRVNLNFSGSSTTDGGLTMNVQTRARATGAATTVWAAPTASISNGSMTLHVGNSTGAIGSTAGIWGCGAIMWGCSDLADDNWSNWASRSSGGAGPDVVRLDMALGGATVSVSGGNGNDAELAVSMPMGGGTVGIGYDTDHDTAAVTAVAASADSVDSDGVYVPGKAAVASSAAVAKAAITQINYSGSVGGLGVGVKLMQQNAVNAYMASVTAPAGGGSVYIFGGKQLDTSNNYGIRYNQSLGGGASMQVGATNAAGTTTIGAAVHFGF
jgi:outer membrane protein OmpU